MHIPQCSSAPATLNRPYGHRALANFDSEALAFQFRAKAARDLGDISHDFLPEGLRGDAVDNLDRFDHAKSFWLARITLLGV